MPKLTFANFLRALSVFADVLSIGYVLFNIRDMSIHDPAISIVFYSLLATILFFLLPYLWNKMSTKSEKVMIVIICLFTVIPLICSWVYLSSIREQKSSNPIGTKRGIKNNEASKKLDTPKTTVEKKEPAMKHYAPLTAKKQVDTLKPQITQSNKNGDNVAGDKNSAKNQFNAGKDNQFNAPIQNGDNNTVVVSERHFTALDEQRFAQALEQLKSNWNMPNPDIELVVNAGSNAAKFALECKDYLNRIGYKARMSNAIMGTMDTTTPIQYLKTGDNEITIMFLILP